MSHDTNGAPERHEPTPERVSLPHGLTAILVLRGQARGADVVLGDPTIPARIRQAAAGTRDRRLTRRAEAGQQATA